MRLHPQYLVVTPVTGTKRACQTTLYTPRSTLEAPRSTLQAPRLLFLLLSLALESFFKLEAS